MLIIQLPRIYLWLTLLAVVFSSTPVFGQPLPPRPNPAGTRPHQAPSSPDWRPRNLRLPPIPSPVPGHRSTHPGGQHAPTIPGPRYPNTRPQDHRHGVGHPSLPPRSSSGAAPNQRQASPLPPAAPGQRYPSRKRPPRQSTGESEAAARGRSKSLDSEAYPKAERRRPARSPVRSSESRGRGEERPAVPYSIVPHYRNPNYQGQAPRSTPRSSPSYSSSQPRPSYRSQRTRGGLTRRSVEFRSGGDGGGGVQGEPWIEPNFPTGPTGGGR